ncbi:MAG: hypothetical protein J6W96_02860 [Alphaproteobacteria bacterium]|nr:hypothetical protein [Alphaproteobacteria bacterium]
MATVKDALKEQRDVHDKFVGDGEIPEPASIAENIPDVGTQLAASQKKMEKKLRDPGAVNVHTLYGKVKTYSTEDYDDYYGFYEQLADSYPDPDDPNAYNIGKKYLKKHNITTYDDELPEQITEYYVSLSIYTYIQALKKAGEKSLSDGEYRKAFMISRGRLYKSIEILNKKGYIVNPETGELEYKNPTTQMAMQVQQQQGR